MAKSHSLAFLSLFLTLFLHLICLSSSSSADQLKFWSENVQNKIPKAILQKLSPLTENDRNYYSNLLSKTSKFTADRNFCSLAKLACASVLKNAKTVTNTYTTQKTYGKRKASHDQIINKNNEDPFSFFRLSNLKTENLIHLPNLQESLPDRAFLPGEIASKIPLTYNAITQIFPGLSKTTKQTIQTSLSYCNADEIQGEIKSCPKSLEEMIGFAKLALGDKKPLLALTSVNMKESNTELKIKMVKKYGADKIVACHEAFLPFAAYFCHSISSTSLYEVEFVDSVDKMLAICHMDTSSWPKDHVAFQILKFGPGEGEACHWFTQLDFAWVAI